MTAVNSDQLTPQMSGRDIPTWQISQPLHLLILSSVFDPLHAISDRIAIQNMIELTNKGTGFSDEIGDTLCSPLYKAQQQSTTSIGATAPHGCG